ncbi:conserved hypothetical protein [Treponema primitia ZAS-2]|uniref:Fibronectin type III domain protein n=1 Tax=Treponema primitia (strain ATCC BAA-887 / DSM 12427 / ZAS-2) TaxID=545694 RepID=F5YNE1_TREPZ|nr:bacterial Ig-like domain-containing protein [Treponema primitia]AEF84452.1 conserved hypothetical protein [Treponema primitia ZAS-2]
MAFLVASCDLFMNKPERNIRDDIKTTVEIANAPIISVTVEAVPAAAGRTNPEGAHTEKQRVPFTVSFIISDEYSFITWQAWQQVNGVETLLSGDQVQFSATGNENFETQVTIINTGSAISVRPLVIARPRMVFNNLPGGEYPRTVTNYPVRIWFAEPLSRESLLDPANSINYKNISVTGKGRFGADPEIDLKGYFNLGLNDDGTLLTLKVNTDKGYIGLPGNTNVTITLETGILTGGEHGVSLLNPVVLHYGVGDKPDRDPPVVEILRGFFQSGGSDKMIDDGDSFRFVYDGSYTFSVEAPTRLAPLDANGKATAIYLVFKAYDELGEIQGVTVSENRIYDLEGGNPVYETDTENVTVYQDYDQFHESLPLDQMATYQSLLSPGESPPLVVRHVIKSAEDGILDLIILPEDSVGNRADPMAAYEPFQAPQRIRVALDFPPDPVKSLTGEYKEPNLEISWANPQAKDLAEIRLSYRNNSAGTPEETIVLPPVSVDYPIGVVKGNNYTIRLTAVDHGDKESSPEEITMTASAPPVATYRIRATASAGGRVSANPIRSAEGGLVTLTATPDRGYRFRGGSLSAKLAEDGASIPLSGNTFTMPAGDVEVSAGFEADEYAITGFNANGGTISAVPAGTRITAGKTVTLTVTPDPGNVLKTLAVKRTDTNGAVMVSGYNNVYTFTMPAGNVELSALFEPLPSNAYLINMAPWINGGFISSPLNYGIAGSLITLTVKPVSGFQIKPNARPTVTRTDTNVKLPVYGATGATAYTFTMPAAAVELSAEFEGLPITIQSPPNKTAFNLGHTLTEADLEGLVVAAVNTNGSSQPLPIALNNISGFNSNVSGVQTLTVTVNGKTASFTVTIRDQGNISIDLDDPNLGLPKDIVISKTSAAPNPKTVTVSVYGTYTAYNWYVNNTEISDSKDRPILILDASKYPLGRNYLRVEVRKGNVYYSREIDFKVEG